MAAYVINPCSTGANTINCPLLGLLQNVIVWWGLISKFGIFPTG